MVNAKWESDLEMPRTAIPQNKGIWRWLGGAIAHLGIAKKIGYGYAFAIGIAVSGTAMGSIVGNYYQNQAEQQLVVADRQQNLLNQLENGVLKVRSHPQQLFAVVGDSIWFEYERSEFLGNIARVEALLSELHEFGDRNPEGVTESSQLRTILTDYATTIAAYEQIVQSLWDRIEQVNASADESAAQQQIVNTIRDRELLALDVEFERLSESLILILHAAEVQYRQAHAGLIRADILRLQMIMVSIMLSVAIATALAIYTSRGIARPIQALTEVARQVTQESNFELKAPVSTTDEVGVLAVSLNQLIAWVGEYTEALENARQTLERRVEERTQDLRAALAELQQTQAQLIQTEKMSSLGQLVAGVAHEINNPVSFIYGNLVHAEEYARDLQEVVDLYEAEGLELSPQTRARLDEIEPDYLREDFPRLLASMKMGTDRIKAIVLSLRNFSRLDEAQMKEASLHEGIDSTLLILGSQLKQGIEVVKEYGDIPLISCYPAQLNQVFVNLLANAIDAMLAANSEVKQLAIATEAVEDRVRVTIRDTGPGIPPQIREKIFDPFFTTKPVGKGTGLGLSICYQIIQKHRGTLEVSSEEGRGSEFVITLPV
ncbi:sensor histidine kinase [Oxynema aestuarii]|uniref:histidine kinase n=1 Tax=Oxynema aestuarii AP17 TaxID=2064643 RepID=A0A6H1U328_9CYAN|nr:ATP-binding protein [Oxynema aestuarii]QIZ72777.1 HAMP domain-containing protein [Oxynema aestuarii AP17]RMH75720.1 MAG: HAMP domain-containing protein [Cyanobacteria bacterium J007]